MWKNAPPISKPMAVCNEPSNLYCQIFNPTTVPQIALPRFALFPVIDHFKSDICRENSIAQSFKIHDFPIPKPHSPTPDLHHSELPDFFVRKSSAKIPPHYFNDPELQGCALTNTQALRSKRRLRVLKNENSIHVIPKPMYISLITSSRVKKCQFRNSELVYD